MTLAAGTRIGPHEVVALLGAGGMGEVYRATDLTLTRQVALKVLSSEFSTDAARVARFQREAQLLASLNHPNIAQIYGLERSDDTYALVMELVEGRTLAELIASEALPIKEALHIARQLTDALEAAHELGIIHRDLKPGNIKVREDGTVKVLDFGLAKALESSASAVHHALSHSPTLTPAAVITGAGVLLGTAAYMPPEQARGRPADRRSDLWAFGCVLYEMLARRRPFNADSIADTIALVLSDEPDWLKLPAGTPAPIERLLRRCLQKDPRQRLASASDARLEIEEALAAPAREWKTGQSRAHLRDRVLAGALALSVAGTFSLVVPAFRHLRERASTAAFEIRTQIVTPPSASPTALALSPDGRQLVFVATVDGQSALWIRSLSTTIARPLAATEGADFPFWSPDSRSVGFFADGSLKRIDVNGGSAQVLAKVAIGRGATWGPDGKIIFGHGLANALSRVDATGGSIQAVTMLGSQHVSHRWPHLLPDGRLLFYVQGAAEIAGIYLDRRDGSQPSRLTPADSAATYMSGCLLWVEQGTLVARRFDARHASLVGDVIVVAEGVGMDSSFRGAVSVSPTGVLAYRTAAEERRQLVWFSRDGVALGSIGGPDANNLLSPRVSPDERQVAVSRRVQNNGDIWMLDGLRMTRFTSDPALDVFPVWAPDGRRLAFRSSRDGRIDLYQKRTDAGTPDQRFLTSDQAKTPTSWSADGRFLLYTSEDSKTGRDIWVATVPTPTALSDSGSSRVLLGTPFEEQRATFSPDGRWIAYDSNESGQFEVYVRKFVDPDSSPQPSITESVSHLISTNGGITPMWSRTGSELYYINEAGDVMGVPIRVTNDEFHPGVPSRLFRAPIVGGGASLTGAQFDTSSDGRFLLNVRLDNDTAPITLLQHFPLLE